MDILVLKIILTLVMVVLTVLFGLVPMKVLKVLRKRAATQSNFEERKWPGLVLCLLSCFTGGVFLATCFLHLLPEVNEHLEELKEALAWHIDYPVAELISCAGFFLVFFLEEVVISLLHLDHGHAHGPAPPTSPIEGKPKIAPIVKETASVVRNAGDSKKPPPASPTSPVPPYSAYDASEIVPASPLDTVLPTTLSATSPPSQNGETVSSPSTGEDEGSSPKTALLRRSTKGDGWRKAKADELNGGATAAAPPAVIVIGNGSGSPKMGAEKRESRASRRGSPFSEKVARLSSVAEKEVRFVTAPSTPTDAKTRDCRACSDPSARDLPSHDDSRDRACSDPFCVDPRHEAARQRRAQSLGCTGCTETCYICRDPLRLVQDYGSFRDEGLCLECAQERTESEEEGVCHAMALAEPEACEGPCEGLDEDPPIVMHSRPHAHSHGVRSITLVLALSFHSIIEGLAFGVQDTTGEVTTLFLSLIIHKCIVAFSVGLQLARTHAHSLRWVFGSIIILALMSPIGCAIGIGVESAESINENSRGIVVLVFEGLAVGTFLYVTFFEVFIHERDNEHPNMLKLLVIVVGFAVIGGIRALEHSHDYGGHSDPTAEHSHD